MWRNSRGEVVGGPHRVGRVIAAAVCCPTVIARTSRRSRGYAVDPPKPMLLECFSRSAGVPGFGVGKIPTTSRIGRGVGGLCHPPRAWPRCIEQIDCRRSLAQMVLCNLGPFRHALRGTHRRRLWQGFGRNSDRLLAAFLPPLQADRKFCDD